MNEPLLDIIIVNYFSVNKILTLLDSIHSANTGASQLNIIVVSNSREQDLDRLRMQEGLTVIENRENVGFGKACNTGLGYCNSRYVLLLNPDTLVLKDTFSRSLQFMETHPDITVLGVKHLNENGKSAPSTAVFPTLRYFLNDILGLSRISPKLFRSATLGSGYGTETSQLVDHVMGAYMLIRKSYLDAFGFMDPRYFVFFEDVDFCRQVWKNNGKIYYAADIAIIHEGSASTDNISSKRLCYSFESKLKYAYKYFSRLEYGILLFAKVCIEPITRLVFAAVKGNMKQMKTTVNAYLLLWQRRQFR